MDKVADVLAYKGHHVETVTVETTVFEAVSRMNERRIGSVMVADRFRPGQRYRPAGIFTERDVLVRVIARGLEPETTLVGDVMTGNPVTISANASVAEAMRIVTEKRCRHLPVIAEDGLCGLISIGDLTKWIVRDQQRTIDDLHDYLRRT